MSHHSIMDRIPVDYLPDDAPWTSTRLPLEVLKTQCKRRGLPADGDRNALQQRLLEYQQTNIVIARSGKWEMRPYTSESQLHHWYWRFRQHLVTRVRDKRDSQGHLRKCFTIASRDQNGDYRPDRPPGIVTFDRDPFCTCVGRIQYNPCSHWLYVLRDVLGCPEPLRWQQSFLHSEIELIYRHSPAARSRVHKDKYLRGDFCFVCFKEHIEQGICAHCTACGMPMDTNCYQNFKKARRATANMEGQCIVCLDKAAWDVEKYREQHQATLAAAITSVHAQEPLLVENDAHSSIEAEIPDSTSHSRSSSTSLSDLDDSGSNWSDFHGELDNNDHGDEQSNDDTYADEDATSPPRPLHRPHTAETSPLTVSERICASPVPPTRPVNAHERSIIQQRSASTPLPGVPADIWLERQQQEREQQQLGQQQQQQQKQAQALHPVITSRRVSILRGPARGHDEEEETDAPEDSIAVVPPGPDDSNLDPASAPTPAQTPAPAPLPASASVPVLAYTTPPAPDVQLAHPPPPAAPDAAPQAVEAEAASTSAGNDVSSGFPAPPVRASPAVGAAHAPEAPETVTDSLGESGGLANAPGDVTNLTNEPTNPAGIPGPAPDPAGSTGTLVSALFDANTIIATTFNNNDITDRKAAKQARKIKRLAKRSDRLRKEAEKGIRKLKGVEKKIRKAEKKAKKRALARGEEGVLEHSEC